MSRLFPVILICFSFLLLTSCGGGGTTSGEEVNYDSVKKMVTDILKTDEGKKAITDVLTDDEMQKTFVLESKLVKDSVAEALTGDKGKEYWKKMFDDPKFVESFGKTLQKQQEDVIKGLMSDSEYQKKMLELLENPEMEDQMLSVLKGQKFREHLEKTIQETLDSPMFKAQMTEIILNAAKEMQSTEGSGGEAESGGGGESGGDKKSGKS
ncbi:spore germination lipoprotein GerD [Aquibacillus kalidii]|uniref:spore germination lipoprotein GerD n=1 Tax=Aquibacillus kalidii TaxID=2762597 RepID=UPI001646C902|nr:spore germination lipoprotein GerD [Aquibacillus kalidii]